jgi:hypothetical protein
LRLVIPDNLLKKENAGKLQSCDCTLRTRRREMKNNSLLPALMIFAVALFSACATMPQTWPDYERSAENKLVVIQEKIGGGLKTNALSPDQTQMFLTTLKGIQTDYEVLRGKRVYRDEWDRLTVRLDALGDEINRAYSRPARIEEPRRIAAPWNGDRIVTLQRRIDDGRMSRRLPSAEEREFQSRLDSIRREYLRMTEGGRYSTSQESSDISRRLDSLETDLNRFQ